MRDDDGFRLDGHLMNGSVSQIDDLFRMAEREVGIASSMTGIGTGAHITGADRCRNRGVRNRSRPAAVSDGLELPIPAGRR